MVSPSKLTVVSKLGKKVGNDVEFINLDAQIKHSPSKIVALAKMLGIDYSSRQKTSDNRS